MRPAPLTFMSLSALIQATSTGVFLYLLYMFQLLPVAFLRANRQTRAIKEQAEQENLKSAVSDHCKRQNHIMDWKKARVIRAESNKYQRWIREAIEIRKRGTSSMNRDEGAYTLSHTWDSVLEKTPDSRGRKFPLLSGKTV
ncbi:hypothetical protein WMY93_000187 [Mugilogobius chulae]|uniref:ATP synthase F0 subunit 8 n=1 Tax=Mugilogobius chulae TaxID=88201 RepID=A0AAW0Q4C3_9GOBI